MLTRIWHVRQPLCGVACLAVLVGALAVLSRGDLPRASAQDKDKKEKAKKDDDKKEGAKKDDDKPKARRGDDAPAGGPTKLYFGTAACSRCHNEAKPLEDKKFPPLCRCTEGVIWDKLDKHKDAYNVLLRDRAKRMGEILGWKVADDARCTSCHGVAVKEGTPTHPSFKKEDGVTCAVCHGSYKEWVSKHGDLLEREDWRKLTREEKEKKFGMIDLWDPAKRAQMCASCHVGNTAEGKVVTHDMYAAGHPPLPSLEIATFSDAMPRHWQYLREKKPEVQKLLQYNPAELERTKLVVASSAVALREAMSLLASEAEAVKPEDEAEGRTLDFAHYDCYACHHDLKYPGFRQQRGYPGKPGRPQFRPWSLALIELGASHAGMQTAEVGDKIKDLRAAFDARPFGVPADVAKAARGVADWAGRLATELDKKNYGEAEAQQLLKKLAAMATSGVTDYDTARQIAWAFDSIYREWDLNGKKIPGMDAALKALGKELKLDLPAGRERDITEELGAALQKLAAFDPAKFKQDFEAIAKLLDAK
jgi:hypothetical protein